MEFLIPNFIKWMKKWESGGDGRIGEKMLKIKHPGKSPALHCRALISMLGLMLGPFKLGAVPVRAGPGFRGDFDISRRHVTDQ